MTPWKIRVVKFHDGSFEATLLYPHRKRRWWRESVVYSHWYAYPIIGPVSLPGIPGPSSSRGSSKEKAIEPLLRHIPMSHPYVVEDT